MHSLLLFLPLLLFDRVLVEILPAAAVEDAAIFDVLIHFCWLQFAVGIGGFGFDDQFLLLQFRFGSQVENLVISRKKQFPFAVTFYQIKLFLKHGKLFHVIVLDANACGGSHFSKVVVFIPRDFVSGGGFLELIFQIEIHFFRFTLLVYNRHYT